MYTIYSEHDASRKIAYIMNAVSSNWIRKKSYKITIRYYQGKYVQNFVRSIVVLKLVESTTFHYRRKLCSKFSRTTQWFRSGCDLSHVQIEHSNGLARTSGVKQFSDVIVIYRQYMDEAFEFGDL